MPPITLACLLLSAAPVTITNGPVTVRLDLDAGTYDVLAGDTVVLAGAHASVGDWSTNDPGRSGTIVVAPTDGTGVTKCLWTSTKPGEPTLLTEFSLDRGAPYLTLRGGLIPVEPARIKRFSPLAGAALRPGATKDDWRTLNAPSGANQTRVGREPYAQSTNNLLATWHEGGVRHSLTLGGLATAEFLKSSAIMPDGGDDGLRRAALGRAWPGLKLLSYLDLGAGEWHAGPQPRLSLTRGKPFTWSTDAAAQRYASVAFDEQGVVLTAEGLDPAKSYVLGWSWWDFDHNGRVESVLAGDRLLVDKAVLPAWQDRHQAPAERAAALPPGSYADGKVTLTFRSDAAVPNAVACEAWLWQSDGAEPPAAWREGQAVSDPPTAGGGPATVSLIAGDNVGRPVAAGETWLSADTFYLDPLTADPFAALEGYGRALKAATGAHPTPYDFPTVCAWYAGVWQTRGAQNHPDKSKYKIATTPGLVEEIAKVHEVGFDRYSRVAGRLVPDNYTNDNPNGWWDDAHWQSQGFYVAPCETSQKWGAAMHQGGGLAITYFQPDRTSADFRKEHPDWLLPGRGILDYSKPEVQAHLKQVYADMKGGVDGMMFDYCDESWGQAQAGGFSDASVTAVAFYRSILKAAKEGLGPGSWIHERSIGSPPGDLALGIADSQRTSGDTDRIDPAMVSRSGLRWYKNRVVLAYDMDSKELNSAWKVKGWSGSDTDGRRMLLTMAYVAASRLLLANSFRDLKPEVLHDLSRTFPYPRDGRPSARPIDAFTTDGWPRVYADAPTPDWRLLTLYNNALPTVEQTLSVPLSAPNAEGGLGLAADREYWAWDFWNQRLAGRYKGNATLSQTLRPGEARVLAIHAVEDHPQWLSTDRHIGQGLLDLPRKPVWRDGVLSGTAQVVAGEPFRIILALNGWQVEAGEGCRVEAAGDGLVAVLIASAAGGVVRWSVRGSR
jgi:hypothetical protein